MIGEKNPPTLIDRFNSHFEQRGDTPALAYGEQTITWADLAERSERIARRLVGEGVRRGDRVAILGENSLAYCILIVGILRAGASVVPLPTLISCEDIVGMAADCGASILFASSALQSAANSVRQCTRARVVIIDGDGAATAATPLRDFLSTGSLGQLPIVAPGDEFNIIYSSGTTGRPKGIIHTHRLRALSSLSLGPVGFPVGARTLTTTALYSNWTLGALTYTLWAGGCLILLPRFSPEALFAACTQSRPHNVFLIPVQIERLLASNIDAATPASLKWCAGSYLAEKLKRDMQSRWPGGMIEIYGMTEGAPFTMLHCDEHRDKLHTVGRSDPLEDVKIIDDEGRELPIGERGEIVGRARSVMDGYNNAPEATRDIVWRDSAGVAYFRSGDIGSLDEDRFLQITGRKKDVIISGGLNLYASDIEAVLELHPAVAEVAVIAVPSTQWGESPLAIVVPRQGFPMSAEDLLGWANQRLGRVQRLSALVFAGELPRGGLGKILRNVLRERYSSLGDGPFDVTR